DLSRMDERDAAELGEHAGAAPGRIVGGELLPEMPQPGQHVPGDDLLELLRPVEALADQLRVEGEEVSAAGRQLRVGRTDEQRLSDEAGGVLCMRVESGVRMDVVVGEDRKSTSLITSLVSLLYCIFYLTITL